MRIYPPTNKQQFEVTDLLTGEKQTISGYKMTIGYKYFTIWGRNFWSLGWPIAEFPKELYNVIQLK
jgi:hypothetical protein